ncbi:hypothetical protein F4780DRAFT_777324 [Xylariomycetidae sp. FL0641]|nr:hypothetical protein F4780DRAFT_777324 [Xylariomycetidae sp. FL0641]
MADKGKASSNGPQNGAGPGGEGGEKRPTTKEKMIEEIAKRVEESKSLQEQSMDLHRRAEEAGDSPEAEDLKQQAKELDKQATKLLKTAKRLEQGWLQGGTVGGGIGAGIAGGLGMTVGTLVTGLVAIPTTGVGILAGAATGLVHGPWVQFTKAFTDKDVEEIDSAAEEAANKIAKANE